LTFAAKRIVIRLQTDGLVDDGVESALGDSMLCYSLFQNLLQNACEASPESGEVVVSLRDESPLRITMKNTGAVEVAIRDRFFDKYVTSGKSGGTGIGTYSAKLLAQAQNGNVTMEASDAENWTNLTVTLPRYTDRQCDSART